MKRLGALMPAILLASLSAPGASAATNLLANGSFETGDFTGWSLGGGAGFTSVVTGYDDGWPGAEDGLYYVFTVFELPGEPNILSQTFTDTPGQTYNVSFWLGHGDEAIDSFSAGVNGADDLDVAPTAFGWTHFGFSFVGTGTDTVQFYLDSFDNGYVFDNASVTVAPEPSAWALLLAGFAGLGAALRSRRRIAPATPLP